MPVISSPAKSSVKPPVRVPYHKRKPWHLIFLINVKVLWKVYFSYLQNQSQIIITTNLLQQPPQTQSMPLFIYSTPWVHAQNDWENFFFSQPKWLCCLQHFPSSSCCSCNLSHLTIHTVTSNSAVPRTGKGKLNSCYFTPCEPPCSLCIFRKPLSLLREM